MTAEQKFVWWLKGFLDSNPDVNFERIKEELDKVTRETVTSPFSFITTTGTSKASNTFVVPYIDSFPSGKLVEVPPYPYTPTPVTFSTVESK